MGKFMHNFGKQGKEKTGWQKQTDKVERIMEAV